ncbi:MAG: ImmA/IrrE family metallo-endopeptidase [Gammaproteobacteria bacterium]|nr:ImmA/IrrE family metallo-endopeptidase [Gammaproteobacteria bacterium]
MDLAVSCVASVWFPNASGPHFPVILINKELSDIQKRFALCHALANMVLPNLLQHNLPVKVRRKYSNCFAGAMLLPTPALRNQLGRRRRWLSLYEVSEIQHQFGISFDRIFTRCRESGIISRGVHRGLIVSFKNEKWKEQSSRQEVSKRLELLAVRAICEGIATANDVADLLRMQRYNPDEFSKVYGLPAVHIRPNL